MKIESRTRALLIQPMLRAGLSAVLLGAGVLHLALPELFLSAMPDYLPWHRFWVAFTGLAEIAAAIGLWVRIPFQAVFIVWAWRLRDHEG